MCVGVGSHLAKLPQDLLFESSNDNADGSKELLVSTLTEAEIADIKVRRPFSGMTNLDA